MSKILAPHVEFIVNGVDYSDRVKQLTRTDFTDGSIRFEAEVVPSAERFVSEVLADYPKEAA